MKSGAHGHQDVETLELQEEPYNPVDLKVMSNTCLARTPAKDPTGWMVQGELWDSLQPLYCGLSANHEGPHASGNVRPGSSLDDSHNSISTYRVLSRKAATPVTKSVFRTNSPDLLLGEFRVPIPFPENLPPLGTHVKIVICLSTQECMRGVTASAVGCITRKIAHIARVADIKPFRDWAVGQLPRNPVRSLVPLTLFFLGGDGEQAVPRSRDVAMKQPTFIGRKAANVPPESVLQWCSHVLTTLRGAHIAVPIPPRVVRKAPTSRGGWAAAVRDSARGAWGGYSIHVGRFQSYRPAPAIASSAGHFHAFIVPDSGGNR